MEALHVKFLFSSGWLNYVLSHFVAALIESLFQKRRFFYPNLYYFLNYKFFPHYIVEQLTYSHGIYHEKKYDFWIYYLV